MAETWHAFYRMVQPNIELVPNFEKKMIEIKVFQPKYKTLCLETTPTYTNSGVFNTHFLIIFTDVGKHFMYLCS